MTKPNLEIKINSQDDKYSKMNHVWELVGKGLKSGAVLITLGREKRTIPQNAKMWPMLKDVADQVEWVLDGVPCHITTDEWKDVFTASLQKQRAMPGIDGGVVFTGISTSKMKKAELSDLIEIIYAFGSGKSVRWSEKAMAAYEKYKEAQ